MKLTERKIETLTVDRGRKDKLVFDAIQRGLAVRVAATGSRNYLCQYTLQGQKWRVPLGACRAVSLAKAREAAAAVMGDVAKGRNPAVERKEAAALEQTRRVRGRLTVSILIQDWAQLHLAYRRPRYAAEAVRALQRAFEKHLGRPAGDLDRNEVVHALDSLRRHKNRVGLHAAPDGAAIAGRTAAYGRACFAWAIKRGSVATNPFVGLPLTISTTRRDRLLSDEEVGRVWRAAGQVAFPYGAIVRVLMLTGQRREEVAGITWAELSEDLGTWTIPASRTKNGVRHLVPLSQPVRDVLYHVLSKNAETVGRIRQDGALLVFPGERGTPFSGWSKAKSQLDGMCGVSNWWLHDLRRTLATGLQRLGIRLEVTEAVLNHVSGTRAGIVGIYQRHDWGTEKRMALEAWADHVLALSGHQD